MASTVTISYPPTETNERKGCGKVPSSSVKDIIGDVVEKDLKARRREYLFTPPQWLQRFFLPALQDSRDEPVAMLLMNILMVTVPTAFTVFLGPQRHLLGLIHVAVNYILLFPRFVVALLHVTEHRRLFRPGTFTTFVHSKVLACEGHPDCGLQLNGRWYWWRELTACACAEYPFRNAIASLLLTPLFGIPSGVYKLHHKVMHHVVSTGSTPLEGSRPCRQSAFA